MGLFAATAGGASTLQKAGSIAAIVGASVAVILLLWGIATWWWRNHHRMRGVKVKVVTSGEEGFYVIAKGYPASTREITAVVSDGKFESRFGPEPVRQGSSEETISLKGPLSRTESHYHVQIFLTSLSNDHRRVFKGKVKQTRYEDS
jgi:hypothetical protein